MFNIKLYYKFNKTIFFSFQIGINDVRREFYIDRMNLHVPVRSTRRRCTLCSRNHIQKRTTIQCKECLVALCSEKQNNCFQLYHQLMAVFPWNLP